MSSLLTTAFLDRDGTINVKAPEGAYIMRPDDLVMLPGAAAAIRRLNDEHITVIVVTNQRGVSRGLMSESDLERIHQRLRDLLAADGAHIDAVYSCTHGHAACDCRKPLPGLVHQAIRDYPQIAPETAAMVGDADSDIELGLRTGLRTVRLRALAPAANAAPAAAGGPAADHDAPDLASAVEWLLSNR